MEKTGSHIGCREKGKKQEQTTSTHQGNSVAEEGFIRNDSTARRGRGTMRGGKEKNSKILA